MPTHNMRRRFLTALGGAGALAAAPQTGTPAGTLAIFNARDFGAVADGVRLDTQALQKAIDTCSKSGGGRVCFPQGTYLSGTLVLRSHVMLDLEAGATLLGSKELADYPSRVPALRSYTDTYTERSLIYAENLENVGIEGRGAINGQGASFKGPYKVRPYLMRFIGCNNVSVSGISLNDSPMWVQHYLACDQVDIRGITVRSRVNANNDGIDIDCCRRVRISDCDIWSGDDSIVLKSSSDRPCKEIVVANCVLSSRCNALKLGTESNGGFENIAILNCTIYDTGLSGLALETVDGGVLDGVAVSNLVMKNVSNPIFIRLGDRGRPFEPGRIPQPVGRLRNIAISNVEASGADRIGCALSGIPGHPIENITLENIRMRSAGGTRREDARRQVPENADAYPDHRNFGALPAYAFYCRHVRNLSLRNIDAGWEQPDERPALVFDDAEGIEISGAQLAGAPGAESSIRLGNSRNAFIHGCRVPAPVAAFVEVADDASSGITLMGNELSMALKPVVGAGAPHAFLSGNHAASGA